MVFHFVWLHHVVVVRDNSHMSDSSLDYAIELVDQVGVNARGAHLVRDRFSEIIEIGMGHLYSPVIYELFENE